MKFVELNREGNFDRWDQNWLRELENIQTSEEYIIYENDSIKVRVIGLETYERMPFQIIEHDFNLICLTGGLAISRFSHGGIWLLNFEKGDSVTHTLTNSAMISDLQNIGEDRIILALVEFKREFAPHLLPCDDSCNTAVAICG